MCCIIPSDPVQDTTGVRKTYDTANKFQTQMIDAPCAKCPGSFCWCACQFIPMTMGCTQYNLRHKLLKGDMRQYQCFQGQFTVCCCIKAGACGEQSCPELCMFAESCFCNSYALSATRYVVMEKYGLSSDPCDNRLIRISNCLQVLSCVCDILAIFDSNFREIARIIGWIADIVYHTVSGCATAQVAVEMNYQDSKPQPTFDPNAVAYAQPYVDPKTGYPIQGQYAPPVQQGYYPGQAPPGQQVYVQQGYPQQGPPGYQGQQYPPQGNGQPVVYSTHYPGNH